MIKFFCLFLVLISLFLFIFFSFLFHSFHFLLSESDKLQLEDVCDSEALFEDELNVKELNHNDEL